MGKPKFKPEAERVRMIITDGPGNCFPKYEGKVFVVIGPFESFTDKVEVQEAMTELLRDWNRRSLQRKRK